MIDPPSLKSPPHHGPLLVLSLLWVLHFRYSCPGSTKWTQCGGRKKGVGNINRASRHVSLGGKSGGEIGAELKGTEWGWAMSKHIIYVH